MVKMHTAQGKNPREFEVWGDLKTWNNG